MNGPADYSCQQDFVFCVFILVFTYQNKNTIDNFFCCGIISSEDNQVYLFGR